MRTEPLMIKRVGEDKAKLDDPIVCKWYVGVIQGFEGDETFGELMQYVGDGAWVSDVEDSEKEPRPSDYDYLQEQI